MIAGEAPCQGYQIGNRIEYPVSGGAISWKTSRDIVNAVVRISSAKIPSSQDQSEDAITNIAGGWVREQCIDGPDLSELGLEAGQNATMQIT